ncbi:NADPH-dependent FMN reductase [Glycomyces buryatensis]|uniref:NAD(P)H-dependent oxidoreductase n=1 Tax=Glycomyces buryatensis TaxID=2570927 RepID=A0A4S8QFX8_9ACTN|nr:NAD(P)H-dependent oxidoreductase [Glycomyces buryatensis]THV41845.1 NAD(P)H-dependent oxidoreductase [Glycomyces buryatensis]
MGDKLNLGVIIGTTREGRWSPVPAKWIADLAAQHGGFEVDLIDLLDAELPQHLAERDMWSTEEDPSESVTKLSERLHRADAFIVVTGEYNLSIPASLKHAIDYYMNEWAAKPVSMITYGGKVSGGQNAAQHLRQVFPELRTMTIRNSIAFPRFFQKFDAQGNFTGFDEVEPEAKKLLDELQWWAKALADARATTALPKPY